MCLGARCTTKRIEQKVLVPAGWWRWRPGDDGLRLTPELNAVHTVRIPEITTAGADRLEKEPAMSIEPKVQPATLLDELHVIH